MISQTFPAFDPTHADHDDHDAVRADRILDVARAAANRLIKGEGISRRRVAKMMTEAFGASDAEGGWSMREAYDALEVAQVLLLGDPASALNNLPDAPSCLAQLERLGAMLPTQTYRSEKQIALQQFSTPLPLAWLVAEAAAMTADDLVLEPSAGTGMLAIHARRRIASG
jgi:hypothetical protein